MKGHRERRRPRIPWKRYSWLRIVSKSKVSLKERAKSYRGPNYWALRALVRERKSCYKGPAIDRELYYGYHVLRKAVRKFFEEARKNPHQPGIAEKYCGHALLLLAKAPTSPPNAKFNWRSYFDIQTQNTGCAKVALSFYNEQNPGAQYELVEAVRSSSIYHGGHFWYHVNFMAKPKNIAASGSCDASPKLFFAEMNFKSLDKLEIYLEGMNRLVCRCSIVDPNDSETLPGCGYCYDSWTQKIYHVVGCFRKGVFKPKYFRSGFKSENFRFGCLNPTYI